MYLKHLKVQLVWVQHLLDLGVDKNRAEEVEEYFDNINPFDEATQKQLQLVKLQNLLLILVVPGGVAFKVGSSG